MRQRWLIVVSAALVLALTGVMWKVKAASEGAAEKTETAADAHDHEGEAPGAHAAEAGPQIEGLQTRRVEPTTVSRTITLNAEVQHNADRSAKVGAPVSGRIVSIRAKVGDHVSAGQTLAVVTSRDIAEAKSALIRAQAEERAAAGRLGTLGQLAASGALTDKPLEDARRDQTSSVASARQAESDLTRARSAKQTALAELERVKKLAEAKAFQAGPMEQAERDVAEAKMELETAQAAVRVKQVAYERSQRLFDAGVAAKREVESAEAEYAEAKARQTEAEAHVDISKRAMDREQSISNQDLYTTAEVRQAQEAVRQAERDVQVAEAELQRAKGHLNVSDGALARERRIAEKGLLAKKELQDAQAELTVARAQVAAAQNTLAAFRATGGRQSGGLANIAIVAPLPGVVTQRDASPGQAVEASTDLFTIHSTDPVWVIASAYQKDLPQIGPGQAVQVRVNGYPEDPFSGSVSHIVRELDAATRTAKVRCVVPNPSGVLRPGMFATVDIATEEQLQALLVPHSAVLDDAGKKVLYARCMECPEDKQPGAKGCGAYDRFEVQLGGRYGDDVHVVEGLEAGSEVVVAGQYQLKTALGSGTLEAGCGGH